MGTRYPSVLIISGLDPCGDAGIISDIRIASALRCRTFGVITCQTIQNETHVEQCSASSARFVDQQISNLTATYHIDAVKIGVVPSAELVKIISTKIELLRKQNPQVSVVIDPVLSASSGYQFCDEDTRHNLLTRLAPLATMLTPNLDEAQLLTSETTAEKSATTLLQKGCQSVFISGIQKSTTQLSHCLYQKTVKPSIIHCQRLPKEFHGSGCVLSSAITSFLAHGLNDITAVDKAVAFTYDELQRRL